jgi:predicted membrane protein
MENLLFIKIEIIIFFLSLLYILYYLGSKIYNVYFKVKNKIKPQKIKKRKTALNKVNLKNKNSIKKSEKILSDNEKKQVDDILQKVKTNASK